MTRLIVVGLLLMQAWPAMAQVSAPVGWRWSVDRQGAASGPTTDSLIEFVQMPPGWHITTKNAATLFDPAATAQGSFALETVQILFPGTSQSGYGLFLGGKGLEGSGAIEYTAFLIRRDGHATVERRSGSTMTTLLPWTPVAEIQRVTGDETARNVIRVSVGRDSVTFEVNAARVGALPKAGVAVDGQFGFRTGADINLHVTTLDHTRRLAPIPKPRPSQ
jgi:hypothetical protein